jgi:hypothetical protein
LLAVRRLLEQPRALFWSLVALAFYLVILGGVTVLGFRADRIETERRCDAYILGFELLGDELEADPQRVEGFVQRLRDETDC